MSIVDGGHRAVIFDRVRGILKETKGEGSHFRIPFVQVCLVVYTMSRYISIAY